jgi:hypothetical protein
MGNDRRNQEAPLVPKMVLFWLVIVIAAGILFIIGGRFLAASAAGAEGFGVPFPRSDAYAYLAAKGIRDVVSGLLLIALLAMGCQRRVLGIFILVAILIPVGDFFTVLAFGGYAAITALLIHGGTALYMIVIGGILLLKPAIDPPTQDPR